MVNNRRKIVMMKTIGLLAVFMVFLLFFSNCTVREASQISEQPNVLLIIIDDLNDYEGSYGGHIPDIDV